MSQQEVLQVMLSRIVNDLGYRAATLRLLNEERQTLELKAFHGLSEAYLSKGAVELAKSGIDSTVLTEKKCLSILDVCSEKGFQYSTAARREGLASLLALPLVLHGKAIGVLHVYSAEKREFSPGEQAFLEGIVGLGAQAIRRAQFFEAFHRLAHNLISSLDLQQVLRTLLLESVKELTCGRDRWTFGPKRQTLHLTTSWGPATRLERKWNWQKVYQKVMKEAGGDRRCYEERGSSTSKRLSGRGYGPFS